MIESCGGSGPADISFRGYSAFAPTLYRLEQELTQGDQAFNQASLIFVLVGYTQRRQEYAFSTLSPTLVCANRHIFATLDSKLRDLQPPSRRKILLSDTVRFIRNLITLSSRTSAPSSKKLSEQKS